jgi:ribosomal protein S2
MNSNNINLETLNQNFLKNKCIYGIKRKQKYLKKYISEYKNRYVILDSNILKENLESLANYLISISPKDLLILNTRSEFDKTLKVFAKYIDCNFKNTKLIPGTLTNPDSKYYLQPKAIFITHNRKEKQAISQAKKSGIKILGLDNISLGLKQYDIVAVN